ncbi:hypothetical protein HanPI659440_Chr04g0182091 [Helianthus annuus]|nr:hypothetical protein HanPI659440_Chr04g0182091 [Helianthus annuus]
MNRRIRRRSTTTSSFLRYLKPGALAQLRDSKIIARTHHRSSDSQIYLSRTLSPQVSSSPSRSPSAAVSTQQPDDTATIAAAVDGGSPFFPVRFYGPRCPQRKKLMAARSICFLNPSSTVVTSDGPEPVIDGFSKIQELMVIF